MNIFDNLKNNEIRNRLFNHSIFQLSPGEFNTEDAEFLLGQYWYPLNYFPTFLSQLIVDASKTSLKCSIADILNEELGQGDITRAHEVIYQDTFESLGFDMKKITSSPPIDATKNLINCYKKGSSNFLVGLGGLYATESTDLAIVSGIGKLLHYATPSKNGNNWINIHLKQEPNHVKQTDFAIEELTSEEESIVIHNAEEMWQCWSDFFDDALLATNIMRNRYIMSETA